jgi:Tfp pilus assembly protein FimV
VRVSADGADGRRVVRVSRGDSLWAIASRLAGPDATSDDVSRIVEVLWRVNEQRIGTGDQDALPVGVTLRIPRSLTA